MAEYRPDNWIVLKLQSHEHSVVYKILAGWSGGYLDGDSWKLNSGITKIEEDDTHYHVHGYSGSVYILNKESECVRMNIAGQLQYLEQQVNESDIPGVSMDVVDMVDILDKFK